MVRAGVDPRLALVIAMITLELALLTAVALFFSTFSSSALVSVGLTVGVFVAGLWYRPAAFSATWWWRHHSLLSLVAGIGWALPAFSEFDVKNQVVHACPCRPASFHTVRTASSTR